jgi:hypothetical protein
MIWQRRAGVPNQQVCHHCPVIKRKLVKPEAGYNTGLWAPQMHRCVAEWLLKGAESKQLSVHALGHWVIQ